MDYPHRTAEIVRFGDLDPQGHVNQAVFLTYFESGRVTMFREPDLSVGVPGIAPWRTPANDFYVVHTAISPPAIAPADWSVRIHGMVEREITLDFAMPVKRPLAPSVNITA